MRRKWIAAGILLCMLCVLCSASCQTTYADTQTECKDFSGEVGFLRQEDGQYVMQVTVGNTGEDFSGLIQLVFGNSDSDSCAYNTEIVLPKDGEKQFTLTIPDKGIDTSRGICTMRFLEENGDILQTISLKNVFGNIVTGISVGILSENADALSRMDLGGQDFYLGNISEPLQLIELDGDNLSAYLDGLYFLIIDQFDMASLGDENLDAIEKWVTDGGWLLVGTGAYVDDTLGGGFGDFLEVSYRKIGEDELSIYASQEHQMGYYYNYKDSGIDFSDMTMVEVSASNQNNFYYESSENPCICGTVGNGAAAVYGFSFAEDALKNGSTYLFQYMYEEVMYDSLSYNNNYGYSDMEYVGQRLLSCIDSENTDVDFTWLKVLIGVYVVLVGPVLYLILRKCKKSEWYWIGAPLLGIVFIMGVFLFGKGIRVNETKAYSVTVQQADGTRVDTFYDAYHSGVKPWSVRLNDNYETAGVGFCGYNYSSSSNGDYHYIVQTDSEGLSIGMKPQENFESGYLYARGYSESRGSITGSNLTEKTTGRIEGSVTNDTAYDMAYFAVLSDSYVQIFEDVKAGETLDVDEATKAGRCVYEGAVSYVEDIYYNVINTYGYASNQNYEQDKMAALVTGLGVVWNQVEDGSQSVCVMGVVEDYDKTIASKCNETSFGCLYGFAELEVKDNAAD